MVAEFVDCSACRLLVDLVGSIARRRFRV